MITYSCDICGQECASVQHVDRYQVTLDLCQRHLDAWCKAIEAMLAQPAARIPALQHKLSRAYIDAAFDLQTQAMVPAEKTWLGPKSPEGLRPVNVDEAVAAFTKLIADFKDQQAAQDMVDEVKAKPSEEA